MYCLLPFGFINVISFVINPSGSYSTFVGADLEYPSLVRFLEEQLIWVEINFEPSYRLWWGCGGDFDASKILVTVGALQSF